MYVTNKTDDQAQVKICLYKTDDALDWIPVGAGVFVVTMNETSHWTAPGAERLPEYKVIAFHPSVIDQKICEGNFSMDDNLTVTGGNGQYKISKN